MPVQESSAMTTSKRELLAVSCWRISLSPLRFRSLAFGLHLTREHVISIASSALRALDFQRAKFLLNDPDTMGKGKSANPAEAHRKQYSYFVFVPLPSLSRKGFAKERTQEGLPFPDCRGTRMLTRPQTVEQGREAEEP
jgi:hypothetical protein